ncbi:helix-turn-helix transcriptional regulator [Brevibacillus sp. NPDC058079]|uniref:helix-turn-helix transcriptional regulator n=1 Tax=Brevibacillus sp. NPDC058079 TaxID=3346330 RepID=UPI0036E42E4A
MREQNDYFAELKTNGKQKIANLEELKEKGLYIIEDDEIVVEMLLPQVLKEKGLLISDLAKLTGISRQNINAVIRNAMKPGVDFVLKVSHVLGEPIDKLFKLRENAWVKPFKIGRDSSVFVDVLHLEVVDNSMKRQAIKSTGKEYFHKNTKETFSKKEYEQMIKTYVEQHVEEKEKEISKKEPKLSRNTINSHAVEELKQEFNNDYSKIYKKIGERFEPYTLNTSKRW